LEGGVSINSRQKGAVHEREVAGKLADLLGIEAERGARNGVPGADDVIGWPGVHVECKRRKKIAALRWLDQSIRDTGDDLPIVIMREDRGPNVLMVRLDDLLALAACVAGATGRPVYPLDPTHPRVVLTLTEDRS
jgi:hypothetical protein